MDERTLTLYTNNAHFGEMVKRGEYEAAIKTDKEIKIIEPAPWTGTPLSCADPAFAINLDEVVVVNSTRGQLSALARDTRGARYYIWLLHLATTSSYYI